MATIKVFGSEYTPGEAAIIYAQVLDDAGMPVSTATVVVSLFNQDDSKYLDSAPMAYIQGSNGLYRTEPFLAPLEVQRMIADVKSGNPGVFGAEECAVTIWTAKIDKLPTDPASMLELAAVHGVGSWEGATPTQMWSHGDRRLTSPKASFRV